MSRRSCLSFFIILLLSGCSSFPQNLYKQKPAFYSYIIADAKTGHIYEEYAADVYATPASCLKTITALIALKHLGVDYQFETKLYKSKNHDIVISFSGDPTFTSEKLLTLLKPIKGSKNTRIIINASIFNTSPHSPNIVVDDIGTYYGSPISGANIDWNRIIIKVMPSEIGKKAKISNDVGYKIVSTLETNSDKSSIKFTMDEEHIKATGNINIKDEPIDAKISPKNIDPYILRKVKAVLKKLNIEGEVVIIHDKNKLPEKLTLLATEKSDKLKELIIPAMKISDNLVFDALYLKIIHSVDPAIDDWSKGNKIIKELIKQYLDIDIGDNLIVDGSGLSRYNRIQPRMLMKILQKGYNIPEFVASLDASGSKGGCLERHPNLAANIIAKTGSMSGISCLCGYSINTNKPGVFVIMASSFSPPLKDIFSITDKFISNRL